MNYFVYVDEILGVKTNYHEFAWSYGTVAPKSSKEQFEKCKIRIHVDVRKSKDVFDKNIDLKKMGKYHYFSAVKGENKIYYERNFFGNSKLRYSIEIHNNEINVIVGQNYMKYVKHRIMGLHSLPYILTDIVAGLMLNNGIATIHCSAVNKDNQTIIIFAPPNTGKTLTSIRLCKNNNFKFISEDFALTDGDNVWAVPWTSTFRYYDEINESKLDTFINKVTTFFPVIELISIKKKKAIDRYLGENSIKYFAEATDVVVLERGESSINRNKIDGFRKIINLNRYEFNYHKAPSIIVMDYFNEGFSPEIMYDTEKKILKKLINKCNYISIAEENAQKYSDIILKEVVK